MSLFLICIDVTTVSYKLGLPTQILISLQTILDHIPYPEHTLIGIIAFDNVLHTFKINANNELLEILVTDVDDPFISEPFNSYCFNVKHDRILLDILIEKLLQKEFCQYYQQSLSIGALVCALKDHALKSRGGRVLIFTSQLGCIGKYKFIQKLDPKIFHNIKENSYHPNKNYFDLSQACCHEDICIDIFACTNTNLNLSDLACLCTQTGGDLYYFPCYNAVDDGERLYYKIARIFTRDQCSQVIMKARCSNGISVQCYIGKFKKKSPSELEVPFLDSDKTITIVMKLDENLREDDDYFLQCAMLFTNRQCERVIRVFNAKMYTSKNLQSIFKYSDIDAMTNAIMKISINNIFELPLNNIRDELIRMPSKILKANKNITDTTNLSMPESLKYLPLYLCNCLKLNSLTIANISLDSRIYSIHAILSMTVLESRQMLYSSVYSLHNIIDQPHMPGTYSQYNRVILPYLLPATLKSLEPNGVYLINNGEISMIYIGNSVDSQFLKNV